MTREEALAIALDYAEGRRSWINVMLQVEASAEDRPQTLMAIAQADAAEVVKWSALAQTLAEGEPVTGPHLTPEREAECAHPKSLWDLMEGVVSCGLCGFVIGEVVLTRDEAAALLAADPGRWPPAALTAARARLRSQTR